MSHVSEILAALTDAGAVPLRKLHETTGIPMPSLRVVLCNSCKDGLVERPQRGHYKITDKGKDAAGNGLLSATDMLVLECVAATPNDAMNHFVSYAKSDPRAAAPAFYRLQARGYIVHRGGSMWRVTEAGSKALRSAWEPWEKAYERAGDAWRAYVNDSYQHYLGQGAHYWTATRAACDVAFRCRPSLDEYQEKGGGTWTVEGDWVPAAKAQLEELRHADDAESLSQAELIQARLEEVSGNGGLARHRGVDRGERHAGRDPDPA